MIYIIHKISVLLKIIWITLKIKLSNASSKFCFLKKNQLMMKSSRLEKKQKRIEDNIIKDVRNLFRIKTERDDATIKDFKKYF